MAHPVLRSTKNRVYSAMMCVLLFGKGSTGGFCHAAQETSGGVFLSQRRRIMHRSTRLLSGFAACLFLLGAITLSITLMEAGSPLTGGLTGDESRREGSIRITGESGIGLALSGCYRLREDGKADVFLPACYARSRSCLFLCKRMRILVELPGGPKGEIPVRTIYTQYAPMFDLGRMDIPTQVVWEAS